MCGDVVEAVQFSERGLGRRLRQLVDDLSVLFTLFERSFGLTLVPIVTPLLIQAGDSADEISSMKLILSARMSDGVGGAPCLPSLRMDASRVGRLGSSESWALLGGGRQNLRTAATCRVRPGQYGPSVRPLWTPYLDTADPSRRTLPRILTPAGI